MMTEKQLYKSVKALSICAVLLVFALLSIICAQLIIKNNQARALEKLESVYIELLEETDELEREIAYRKSKAFFEQYAREYHGYTYENEEKYVIEDTSENP